MEYYVSSAGDDAAAGTIDAPWKTLDKVMNTVLSPGDMVFMHRGDTFSPANGFAVKQSGTGEAPIVFTAYGDGDRPIVVGPANKNTFDISNREYIVVEDIYAQANADSYSGFNMNPANHVLIVGCEASGSLYGGIFIHGDPDKTFDIVVYYCDVHDCPNFAIISSNTSGPGPDSIDISDNYVWDNGTNISAHHGIYCKYTTNATVYLNVCWGNASGGIKINQEGEESTCAGTVVDSNECYENGTGIWMSASEVVYTNNLIYDSVYDGIHVLNDGGDCLVAHNTIVNCFSFGIHLQDNAPGISGYTFKNNLVLQNKAVLGENRECIRVAGDGTAQAENNVWDYNLYYCDGYSQMVNIQSAAGLKMGGWQILTDQETHSSFVDPKFVSEFDDLHLSDTSWAIDHGDSNVGIILDKDGVERGLYVDIGCYEFEAGEDPEDPEDPGEPIPQEVCTLSDYAISFSNFADQAEFITGWESLGGYVDNIFFADGTLALAADGVSLPINYHSASMQLRYFNRQIFEFDIFTPGGGVDPDGRGIPIWSAYPYLYMLYLTDTGTFVLYANEGHFWDEDGNNDTVLWSGDAPTTGAHYGITVDLEYGFAEFRVDGEEVWGDWLGVSANWCAVEWKFGGMDDKQTVAVLYHDFVFDPLLPLTATFENDLSDGGWFYEFGQGNAGYVTPQWTDSELPPRASFTTDNNTDLILKSRQLIPTINTIQFCLNMPTAQENNSTVFRDSFGWSPGND